MKFVTVRMAEFMIDSRVCNIFIFIVNNLVHSAQSQSIAVYLQQVVYNFASEDKNFSYIRVNRNWREIKVVCNQLFN